MAQRIRLTAAVDIDIEMTIKSILACRRHCNASGQAGEDVHLIRAHLLQNHARTQSQVDLTAYQEN